MQPHPQSEPERAPSVPDAESEPPTYDEPEAPPADDHLPPGDAGDVPPDSPAVLRLRVEELLRRREPPSADAWRMLGPRSADMLVRLLDDPVVAADEALRQRVIATVAQLGLGDAVARLQQALLDRAETALTRTYAANALGRIDPDAAVAVLTEASTDESPMVRRQVARALGAARDPAAVAPLERLLDDPVAPVADIAAERLRALGRDVRPPEPGDRRNPAPPAPEITG
jgi:HEAT repeat protein